MEKINKKTTTENCCSNFKKTYHHDSGAIYGIGIFGALFYFLQNATTFSMVMVGIFKSIFWPAFLIFKIFTDLKL